MDLLCLNSSKIPYQTKNISQVNRILQIVTVKSTQTLYFYIGTFRYPLTASPTIFLLPVKVMELGSPCRVHFQQSHQQLVEAWRHARGNRNPLLRRCGQTPSLEQFGQSKTLREHEGQTGIGTSAGPRITTHGQCIGTNPTRENICSQSIIASLQKHLRCHVARLSTMTRGSFHIFCDGHCEVNQHHLTK